MAERRIIVSVPVECIATIDAETKRVVEVVFLPRESDAGYFGPGTSLYDVTEDDSSVDATDEDAAAIAEAMANDWAPLYELAGCESIRWEG
jgi:hypothetical protein